MFKSNLPIIKFPFDINQEYSVKKALFLYQFTKIDRMKQFNILIIILLMFSLQGKLSAQLLPLEQLESDDIETYTSIDRAYLEKENAFKLKIFQLHSSLPPVIAQLDKLQALYMENLYFELLTERFGNLTDLQVLSFKNNKIDSLPERFSNLKNLKKLNLNTNRFKHFPKQLLSLTALQRLDLGHNEIDSIPEGIENLAALSELIINNNYLKFVSDNVSKLENLSELNLYQNKLENLPES